MNDKQILEPNYFNFTLNICDQIPRTSLTTSNPSLILATKLGLSFLLDVYVHARDKPNIIQWIELISKYLTASSEACTWLIDHLATNETEKSNCLNWCTKIFFKCPNSAMRHMFQRLFLAALNRVFNEQSGSSRSSAEKFLKFFLDLIGSVSCTFKFNIRFMAEYFGFLIEFAREGADQCMVLLRSGTIEKCIRFYLANRKPQGYKKQTVASGKVPRQEDTAGSNGGESECVKAKRRKVCKFQLKTQYFKIKLN